VGQLNCFLVEKCFFRGKKLYHIKTWQEITSLLNSKHEEEEEKQVRTETGLGEKT